MPAAAAELGAQALKRQTTQIRQFVETGAGRSVALAEVAGPAGSSKKTGSRVKVVVIEAGLNLNKRLYSTEVLRKAVPLFENAPVYVDHPRAFESTHSARDVVGKLVNVGYDQGLDAMVGEVKLLQTDEVKWLRDTLAEEPDILGFSIFCECSYADVIDEGSGDYRYTDIIEIHRAFSLDVVDIPAAGGRVLEVMESMNARTSPPAPQTPNEEGTTAMSDNTQATVKLVAEAREEARKATVTEYEAKIEKVTEALKASDAQVTALTAEKTELTGQVAQLKEGLDAAAAQVEKLKAEKAELEQANALKDTAACVESALKDSGLPAATKARIKKAFENKVAGEAEVAEAIAGAKSYLDELGVKEESGVIGAGAPFGANLEGGAQPPKAPGAAAPAAMTEAEAIAEVSRRKIMTAIGITD